ncbi:MAG: hypothetical protein ACE5IF_00450 [Candidatus Bathyarchaeia archaeon]
MSLLRIENLHVNTGEQETLGGINIEVRNGDTYVLMGPRDILRYKSR